MGQSNEKGAIPIVVVEDLHIMRKAIRRTIEREPGYVIEEFSNGNDAIAFLKKNPVHLVISDIFMSNGDGFDVLRYVRGRPVANDIPVVFITGEGTKDDIVHAVDLGATDYILKPFEPPELLAKIKSVLARYQNPPERIQMLRTAESWLLLGDLEQAESMFQDLFALDAKSPRVLIGMAQIEVQKNNKDAAIQYVLQAINNNPMYFPAYSLGANIYLDLGNKKDAIELLLRELNINGKQSDRRVLLAELYASMEEFPKAFEQMRAALQEYPKDERLLLRMGELFFHAGDVEKSIHYFLKTRRSHPKSIRALDSVTHVAIQSGKPTRALYAFTDLLKLNPSQKDIYFARAKLYEKLEDFENALADIDVFLASHAESVEGYQAKARILNKLDRGTEALDVWKKIVALSPTAENLGKLGLLLLKTGDYLGASSTYEKALALTPDNHKFHFNLACAYENLNAVSRAIRAYENFLALSPGNTDALEALARLRATVQPAQTSAMNTPRQAAPEAAVDDKQSKVRSLERKRPPRAS